MAALASRRVQRLGLAAEVTRGALGGFAGGAGFGAWVGSLSVRANPSLGGPGQVTGFILLCVAGYAVALGLLGVIAAYLARPFCRPRATSSDYLPDFVAPLVGAFVFALAQSVIRALDATRGESDPLRLGGAVAACVAVAIVLRALLTRLEAATNACWGAVAVLALSTPVVVWSTLRANGVLSFRAAASDSGAPASAVPSATPRVMLIAVDGADWTRLAPLIAAGRLPNFARLRRGAFATPLDPLGAACSPAQWTSIATGVSAEVHGVFDASEITLPILERGVQRAVASAQGAPMLTRNVGLAPALAALTRLGVVPTFPISAAQRRCKALWNVLAERGARVGVVHWPATWPAERLEGTVVADNGPLLHAFAAAKLGESADAAAARTTWPPDLVGELQRLIELDGPFCGTGEAELERLLAEPVLAELDVVQRAELAADARRCELIELTLRGDRFAQRTALHLWNQEQVALLAVRFRAIASLEDCVPESAGTADRAYAFVDGLLRGLVDAGGDATTFVLVSERGRRPELEADGAKPGVFVIHGPGVVAQPAGELVATVFDVAPTVLALYGLPASSSWPGRALVEAFTPAALPAQRAPIASYGAYTASWPALSDITTLPSQREALDLLRALEALRE